MKLIDIMRMTASQMGKLYFGRGTIVSSSSYEGSNDEVFIHDPTIRMNDDDHLGGTMFLVNQSYTIADTTIDGTFKLMGLVGSLNPLPISTDPIAPDENPIIPDENYIFPELGSVYSYSFTDMDRSTLVNAINTALLAMGEHTTYQDLDVTATEHREFILPVGLNAPLKIEFFNYVSDGFVFSSTNAWDLSVKAGQNVLTFQNRIVPAETAKIRVWYNEPHRMVIYDEDEIDPDFHTRRLVYEAAYWGYFQFLAKEQNSSDRDLLLYQAILQERETLANKHPVPRLLHKITLPRN